MRPVALWVVVLLFAGGTLPAQEFSRLFDAPAYRAFDFWVGEWEADLAIKSDSNLWIPWKKATVRVYPVLGGKAIMELWDEQTEEPGGLRGFSLRYFNPSREQWDLILHWPQPNQGRVTVFRGYQSGTRFEFYNRFPVNDSVTQWVRFTFSDITHNSLRWDDGYSRDGGMSWRENWRMHFTRLRERPLPLDPASPFTYHSGNRCTDPVYAEIARWAAMEKVTWGGQEYAASGFRILDGCASLLFLSPMDDRENETLLLISHDAASGNLHVVRLQNDENPARMYSGDGQHLIAEDTRETYQIDMHSSSVSLSRQ